MNLPERLRALPVYDPPADGWQQLSARMNARRQRWIAAGGGLALAASVLVAIGLAGLRPLQAPAPAVTVSRTAAGVIEEDLRSPALAHGAAPAGIEVAQLIHRSQRLETQLRQARPQVAVWDSGRARRADLLEQELSLIDAQLSYARSDGDPTGMERLWSQRVQLMDALLQLHQNEAPALHYASYQY